MVDGVVLARVYAWCQTIQNERSAFPFSVCCRSIRRRRYPAINAPPAGWRMVYAILPIPIAPQTPPRFILQNWSPRFTFSDACSELKATWLSAARTQGALGILLWYAIALTGIYNTHQHIDARDERERCIYRIQIHMRQHRFKIYWDVIRLALDPVCFFSTRLGVCVCAVFVCCICKNEKWESTTLNVIPHIQRPRLPLSLFLILCVRVRTNVLYTVRTLYTI